jgi:transposase-like protein
MEQVAANDSKGFAQEARDCLAAEYFDEARCRQWFLQRFYPNGCRCPDCGSAVESERSRATFLELRRFTCSACGNQPRPTKGTILQDSPLTPRDLYLLAILIGLGVEDRDIARSLSVTRETVANWREKIAAFDEVSRA